MGLLQPPSSQAENTWLQAPHLTPEPSLPVPIWSGEETPAGSRLSESALGACVLGAPPLMRCPGPELATLGFRLPIAAG